MTFKEKMIVFWQILVTYTVILCHSVSFRVTNCVEILRKKAAVFGRPPDRSRRSRFYNFIHSPILWLGYSLVRIILFLKDFHIVRFLFGLRD